MLMEEFTNYTGYRPTVEEYENIENLYYEFDGNKEKFCRAWKNLYMHKVKAQAIKDAASKTLLTAVEKFSAIEKFDFGYMANAKIHPFASIAVKIAKRLRADKDAHAIFAIPLTYDEGGCMCGIQTKYQLYDEGLSVLITNDLHCLEFNRKCGEKVIQLIANITEKHYDFMQEELKKIKKSKKSRKQQVSLGR